MVGVFHEDDCHNWLLWCAGDCYHHLSLLARRLWEGYHPLLADLVGLVQVVLVRGVTGPVFVFRLVVGNFRLVLDTGYRPL